MIKKCRYRIVKNGVVEICKGYDTPQQYNMKCLKETIKNIKNERKGYDTEETHKCYLEKYQKALYYLQNHKKLLDIITKEKKNENKNSFKKG